MTQTFWKRSWGIVLLAAIFAVPFVPRDASRVGLLRAQEEPEATGAGEGAPHAECTYFTEFPQHSARGPAILERIELPEEVVYQLSLPDAETVAVTRKLPRSVHGNPVAPYHISSLIDVHIFNALERNRIPPANLATDAEFLRRVTLDLTGRIPTAAQVTEFAADADPQKRGRLIEQLLASPEWVDRWTMWLGDLLKNNVRSTQVTRYNEGRDAFRQYIKTSLEGNKPYNQFVSELITAVGDSFTTGEVNFTVGGQMTMGPVQDTYDKQWVQVATTFLGLKNFDCLLCHDGAGHLDAVNLWGSRVTRYQAWGMAAYFSRTRIFRPTREQLSYMVEERTTGGYTLNTNSGNRPLRAPAPGQSQTVVPTYLFNGRRATAGENYREVLAQQVTSDFQFARATVNYLWAHFFGVGIVDPPDGFDLARLDPKNPPPAPWTIQPSHPQLLDELARQFILSNYDLKALMRDICNSLAYQLSSRYDEAKWSPAYTRFYARHLVRRLQSEELVDALVEASGVPNPMRIAGYPEPIPWAMQLPDTQNPGGAVGAFMNTFLRGDRDENPRRWDLSVSQALDLMNDPFVIQRVRASTANGLLAQLLASPLSDPQLVQTLYLTVLSRYPTAEELAASVQLLRSGTRRTRAEDLLWSLYNKVDFIFNY